MFPYPNRISSTKLEQSQRAPESNGGHTDHHGQVIDDLAEPLLTYLTEGHLSMQPYYASQ